MPDRQKDTYAAVGVMVRECENYRDDLSEDRTEAMQYYDGDPTLVPYDAGRSKVVSRDVRAAHKKAMPSILRTILGGDEVVEYSPVEEGDEDHASQASDYINYVVLPESDGHTAIKDAIHDAARLRNGILTWWYDERIEIEVSKHTGLPEEAFAALVAEDDVEVLEHSETQQVIETEEGEIPVILHDVKIKRRKKCRKPKAAAVPPEEFLIHPDAVTLEDSPVVGRKQKLRRSELVSMGYDKDMIWGIPVTGADDTEEDEKSERREVYQTDNSEIDPALQEIDYYELYVRTDMDGDGIAELRRMCFAGTVNEKGNLLDEECDEVQFCDLVCERRPHQWEGQSITDDVAEIQRIKTVLLRQTLDNLYWQNNPQDLAQEGAVVNMDAVVNPQFGKTIRVRDGTDVRAALGHRQVPFVAKESFGMLEYMDNEITDRTGISDASSGLAPDALQNMTAKASAMVEQSGIGQTEMIVRTIADGLKKFFRGLLRLVIKHQDVPRTVRLRKEWVTFDPRHWNSSMDVTVNTGLGAGTRERDMMVMRIVLEMQEKMLAGFGPDNPFVKPDNVYNAAVKQIEAAGLRTPGLYITEPDPKEVEQRMSALRNQPNPEQMKIEAQKELEMAKMQSAAAKEKAQMDADLTVKNAEIQANTQSQAEKLEADAIKQERLFEFEREKMAFEAELRREEMRAETERQIRLKQMELEAAEQRAQADDFKGMLESREAA